MNMLKNIIKKIYLFSFNCFCKYYRIKKRIKKDWKIL